MSATKRSPADYRLAAEALAMLLLARLAFVCLRFPVAMAVLRLRLCPRGDGAAAGGSGGDPLVGAVRLAVRRAAGRAPFRAVCLQQAVAAALMLRRRGRQVEVHFGVARDDGQALTAHAWSICRGLVVTGQAAMDRHMPIAVFVT